MNKSSKINRDVDTVERESKPIQGKITCKHCSYEWDTRSTLAHVMCPSCGGRNKNPFGLFWKRKEQTV